MVTGIDNITDFTNELSSGDQFDFEAKISSNYVNIFPASFRYRMCFLEFLKHNNIEPSVVSGYLIRH